MSIAPDPLPSAGSALADPCRLLVEATLGYAMFVLDAAGQVASWHAGAERLFGWRAEEALRRCYAHFFPAEDQAAGQPRQVLQRALAEEHCEVEGPRLRRDGSQFWAAETVTALLGPGGAHLGFTVVTRDASAQHAREQEYARTQAALHASEMRCRTVFEHAQVGILLADPQGRYLDVNTSAGRMLGYAREELIGRQGEDIVAPSEFTQIEPALNDINGQVGHRREWLFRRKDGSVFPVDVVATLLPDGSVLATLRDISDSQQARAYRERLAAIVESSTDAIISKDLDGVVTSWNTGAQGVFGYSAAEMLGSSITRLIPEDRLAEETFILERLRRGERVDGLETQRRRKDGGLIDVSITVSPLRDSHGRIIGASKIARDISTLKEREREVARLSRLYAALSQVNQAIVWSPTRDELFRKICRTLVEDGGFHLAWIGWHDPATARLRPVAECGDENGFLQSILVTVDDRPEGRGPSGTAFRTGQPYVSNDLLGDPATLPWRGELERRGFRAAATFPIREQGQVRGTLSVFARQRDFFHDREIALLTEAAADVSFALDNFVREESRRQAERTLRDEKRFSDTMIDSMPGVLYFYDGQGRFLRWNRNFEAVTGYSATEIGRMQPVEFFAGADKQRVAERIGAVFTHGESSVEAEFVVKDGSAIPYFFTGRRVHFGGQDCLVGVGIDISDRRRAERRLAESERKYRELVEDANSIILRWTADGRIAFLNEFGQRFFGYSAEEIVGQLVAGTIVPSVESGGRDLTKLMEEICAAPERFEQNVNENIRRNGERVWVAWTNRIVRDTQGKVAEILSIGTDITARRQAEEEREKRHRAEAADRIKSAFLATMSHELRTPLNSIIGFTGIILQGLAGPLNAEQTKQLEMVRTSARHLLALVNDVLDISKIEAGQLEVERAPFDLPQSLTRVINLVRPQAEAKRLALRVEISPALGRAVSDQRRFEQIALNLLSNAIKFTEQGAVALTAERIEDYAPPGAAAQPAVRVAVADTGTGIRAEDLPTLFQPFRQVDAGLARKHDGTGLGLAICRRLAELMGGTIGAESVWGQGSTFSVTLPLEGPVKP
ncbi:MAG: PAS domain S-box protein [Planctomycetia bacterium]|nr:PAS domain S-box protein [Planctomycetia bacterium]